MECGEHGEGEIIQVIGLARSYPYLLEKASGDPLGDIQVLSGEHRYLQLFGKGFHSPQMIPMHMGKEDELYIFDIEAESLCPAAEFGE